MNMIGLNIQSIIVSTLLSSLMLWIFFFISKKNRGARYIVLVLTSVLLIYYFGPLSFLFYSAFFIFSSMLGYKILKFKNDFTSGFMMGFFVLLEIFTIISLIFSPNFGFLTLFFCFLVLFFYKNNQNFEFFTTTLSKTSNFLFNLNVLDIWLIIISFLIGSQPQTHWDAVHANLYNAKWYIENNSFSVIRESISSLFPQNAITYYSMFYKFGALKSLQISYLFPLLMLIIYIKKFIKQIKTDSFIRYFLYLFITVPIIIFESTNGYYDLLLLVVLLSAFYIIYFDVHRIPKINLFCSSFLIGFAIGIKYFPGLFIFLPFFNYHYKNREEKNSIKILALLAVSLVITILPIMPWLIRTYLYTGNPFFPFLLQVFKSPLWSINNKFFVENDFVIKSTLSSFNWFFGGSLIYPLLTYHFINIFFTLSYGYTGIIYVILIPVMIVFCGLELIRVIKNKLDKNSLFILYSFISYFLIGFITRYFRYLWPYQFILYLFILIRLSNLAFFQKKYDKLLMIIFIIIFTINLRDIVTSFKYIPIYSKRFFQSDYFQKNKDKNNPILFLNMIKNPKNIKILDSSDNPIMLPRVQIIGEVTQCSWYLINIDNELGKIYKDIKHEESWVKLFDYVIVSKKYTQPNMCKPFLEGLKNIFLIVYKDNDYIIYKVIK